MVNTSTIVLIVAVLLLLLVFLALFYRRMTGVPATVAAAPSPGATTYASTAPSTYSQAAAGGAYGSQLQAAPVTAPTHFVQPPSTTVVVPPATSGSTAPLLVTNTSTVSSSGTATSSSGTAQPMGVQLFAHTGLSPTDNTMFLPPGDYRFSTSPWSRFNNEASGLRVSSGCTAQFWANNDFTGKTLTYTGPFAVSDLGPTGLKNDISAVKVRCS